MCDIQKFLEKQEKFSNLYYDANTMSDDQKQEMLKTLCLAMHNEVSSIVKSTNFKMFGEKSSIDEISLLYNSIDTFRYLLAIWNLSNLSSKEIIEAFDERDVMLHSARSNIDYEKSKKDKVIIVDIDDVLAEFREDFNEWLRKNCNVDIDDNSKSYYSSVEVKKAGFSPEKVFIDFVEQGNLLNIRPIFNMIIKINELYNKGYYIQLLTSRPESNLRCKNQTYVWLKNAGLKYDNLSFASEKYLWVARQDFYMQNKVVFAIDDSPKHALEYASHGVTCLIPKTSYNSDIAGKKNIYHFEKQNIEFIDNFINTNLSATIK